MCSGKLIGPDWQYTCLVGVICFLRTVSVQLHISHLIILWAVHSTVADGCRQYLIMLRTISSVFRDAAQWMRV